MPSSEHAGGPAAVAVLDNDPFAARALRPSCPTIPVISV